MSHSHKQLINYYRYCAGNNQLSSLLTTVSDVTNYRISGTHAEKAGRLTHLLTT
ncbi:MULTISPECIES: hypothetical protein [Psychrobacter]|uniref:hypothetical protein n=1 Tax=Psychrobacter TaxID=497 RepID=UPI0012EB6282|nr:MULTISPECIES: hypothetical protein [Psychrobacter]